MLMCSAYTAEASQKATDRAKVMINEAIKESVQLPMVAISRAAASTSSHYKEDISYSRNGRLALVTIRISKGDETGINEVTLKFCMFC